MKKNLILLIGLAMTSVVANAQLKNASGNATLAKIEEANKKVTALQCPFTRTQKVAALNSSTKAEGTFYYASPSSLSMKYSGSKESFVVTEDNVSMTTADGKSRKLRSGNHRVEDLAETLVACVKGNVTAIEGKLKSAKTVGKTTVVTIETDIVKVRSKITSVELTYDNSDYTLKTLKMIEADGSYEQYDLGSKTLNGSIDKAVFTHSERKKGK